MHRGLLFMAVLWGTSAFAELRFQSKVGRFVLEVEAKPSRPLAKGQGPCGAGEEVTLRVRDGKRRVVFQKLLESCLLDVALDGDEPHEGRVFFERALHVDGDVVELRWLFVGARRQVVGRLDLRGKAPQYEEHDEAVDAGEVP